MRVRYLNKYRLVYLPKHPKAMRSRNWKGFVYEHIVVLEEKLGRPLQAGEVTHHEDENRSNNDPDNLSVMQKGKHASHHNDRKPRSDCIICGTTVTTPQNKYCSYKCYRLAMRKVDRPSKEELRLLLNQKSFRAVGRQFGVSDNAVRKWARSYSLLGL